VSDIYENYEKALKRSNSLDFDDLLLFGVKLFRNHPKAVDWCSHVLIDELYVLVPTSYSKTYDGYFLVRILMPSSTS
jgi:DNA helicase-2/ATP-dependent DNA helicase PcrA